MTVAGCAPSIEPADIQPKVRRYVLRRVSKGVIRQHIIRNLRDSDSADAGVRPGEVLLNYFLTQSQGFKDLCA